MNVVMAFVAFPVGVVLGVVLAGLLNLVLGWGFLRLAAFALVPPPLNAVVAIGLGLPVAATAFGLVAVLVLIVLLFFFAYWLATSGTPVPAVAAGLVAAGPAERAGRGALVGLNAGLNFALAVPLYALLPLGLPVAFAITIVNFLACVIAVSNNAVYQVVLGYTAMFLPMAMPINVLGFLTLVVNLVASAFGTTVTISAIWPRANLLMHGGIVHGCLRTAFNLCNYSIAHPAMAVGTPWVDPGTPVWPFCGALGLVPGGGVRTTTVGGVMLHESSHMLNVGAFGTIYHAIGALDEFVPMPWSGGAVLGANAHSELTAESGLRSMGTNWLDMWAPTVAAAAAGNVNAVASVAVSPAPGVVPIAPTRFGLAVDAAGNAFVADASRNRVIRIPAGGGAPVTVSGNGTAGFAGDGGPAIAASLSRPAGVAVDAAGDLFIADTGNHCVRRVVAATGVIATIAGAPPAAGGAPPAGFAGDGGLATAARLSGPRGVAVDAAGNVLIADTENHCVRRVAMGGIITTVAGTGTLANYAGDGGAATAATLAGPGGVAVDAAGNLFIADTRNNVIRRVDAPTGVIATLGGPGAGLSMPAGVALDATGAVLIADTGNHRIALLAPGAIALTTIAGTPSTAGFSGDGGPATAATLTAPTAAARDAAGNTFIGDAGNNRVRGVAVAGGAIGTLAATVGVVGVVSEPNRLVTLDSTSSADPDGGPLGIGRLWQLVGSPAASTASILLPTAPTFAFTPDVGGIFTLTLDVTDGADGGPAAGTRGPLIVNIDTLGARIDVPLTLPAAGTPVTLRNRSRVPIPGGIGAAAITWVIVAGPTLVGTPGAGATFTFTPAAGTYTIDMTVARAYESLAGGPPVLLRDAARATLTFA